MKRQSRLAIFAVQSLEDTQLLGQLNVSLSRTQRIRFKPSITLRSFVVSLVLSAGSLVQAQATYSFKTFDVPGTATTLVYGNNGTGHIAGEYFAIESVGGWFLLSQGVFKNLSFPGAIRTAPEGINAKGQVVGIYIDKSGASHGFQLRGTAYASIDFPKSALTYAYSINQSGVIVGTYYDGSRYHGFMLQGTQFTTIDYQSAAGNVAGSTVNNINDKGDVVGIYSLTDPKLINGVHGYLQTGSVYTNIDDPNGQQTGCEGINNSGQVVGDYVDSAGISHGFTFISGVYATIDYPGATASSPIQY
jgi:hypothetical protein